MEHGQIQKYNSLSGLVLHSMNTIKTHFCFQFSPIASVTEVRLLPALFLPTCTSSMKHKVKSIQAYIRCHQFFSVIQVVHCNYSLWAKVVVIWIGRYQQHICKRTERSKLPSIQDTPKKWRWKDQLWHTFASVQLCIKIFFVVVFGFLVVFTTAGQQPTLILLFQSEDQDLEKVWMKRIWKYCIHTY